MFSISLSSGQAQPALGSADREGGGQDARVLRGAGVGQGHRGAGYAHGRAVREHPVAGTGRGVNAFIQQRVEGQRSYGIPFIWSRIGSGQVINLAHYLFLCFLNSSCNSCRFCQSQHVQTLFPTNGDMEVYLQASFKVCGEERKEEALLLSFASASSFDSPSLSRGVLVSSLWPR